MRARHWLPASTRAAKASATTHGTERGAGRWRFSFARRVIFWMFCFRIAFVLITTTTLPAVTWLAANPLQRPAASQLLVLRVRVAAFEALVAAAPQLLPPEELLRAGRYRHAADRLRFVVARMALRGVLGRWLGLPSAAIRLGVGPHKKPFLADDPTLHFSLAHTREWVLLALATNPLGVDVEHVDPAFPFADILFASFSAAEQAVIGQAPEARRQFYQLWTRKEALVKATGQGLDDTLPTLPVLDGSHPSPTAQAWHLASFAVADDHLAALAYSGAECGNIAFYDLTPEYLLATASS